MEWYDPRSWFEIGGTGFNPVAERDKYYQDYAIQSDPFARQLRNRMAGQGHLGAEDQARRGAEQQRRQAMGMASSGPGVRVGQATRAAEQAGDYADVYGQQAAQQARAQDQYMSEQALGQLLSGQSQAQQQRSELDALYAQMGLQAAKSDFETTQVEEAGFLAALGNIAASIFERTEGEDAPENRG